MQTAAKILNVEMVGRGGSTAAVLTIEVPHYTHDPALDLAKGETNGEKRNALLEAHRQGLEAKKAELLALAGKEGILTFSYNVKVAEPAKEEVKKEEPKK